MAAASAAAGAEAGAGSSRTRACQTGLGPRGRCHNGNDKSAGIAEIIFINLILLCNRQFS